MSDQQELCPASEDMLAEAGPDGMDLMLCPRTGLGNFQKQDISEAAGRRHQSALRKAGKQQGAIMLCEVSGEPLVQP
jgi:hypothetical protein